MVEPKPIPGYVRCGVTHITGGWSFEVMSEEQRVAILDIDTPDGRLSIGLNKEDAENLQRTLELFLKDWPKGQSAS